MENQSRRDTPLFEELSGEVTVTDPTHPLYGQTLPLLGLRTYRSKTHVTVLLPTGRRRSVPRAATDLERQAEEAWTHFPLPVISVRTILPLARFVQELKQAKEEGDASPQARDEKPTDQRSTNHLAPAPTCQSTADGTPGRRVTPARSSSKKRRGG